MLQQLPDVRVLAMPVRPERKGELEAQGITVAADWAAAHALGATHAIVATNTARHATDAADAIRSGCEVLVEKPLAVDSAEAGRIAALASASQRSVWVGCCLRFLKGMDRTRQLLPALGDLHSVRVECQSFLPAWRPDRDFRSSYAAQATEGGVLRDLIHEVDYATWLFGWPASVQAGLMNSGRLGIEAEEAADLNWAVGHLAVSVRLDYLTRQTRRRLAVDGELGSLVWDLSGGVIDLALAGSPAAREEVGEASDDKYKAQAEAFLRASGETGDDRLASAESGVRALALCDAARRASASRHTEAVEYQNR